MALHHVPANPSTIQLGIFDSRIPPVLTIESGDSVTMQCLSGSREVMPADEGTFPIPPVLRAIHEANLPRIGPHMLTGPVGIAGAQPGDMLEIHIDEISLGADWGYCGFRPLAGTLPEDFDYALMSHIPIDRAARTCRLPWGPELQLSPFFGILGVSPPASHGRIFQQGTPRPRRQSR